MPNLLQHAGDAHRRKAHWEAIKAYVVATVFRPLLLLQPWFVASFASAVLRLPPRD